MDFIYDPKFLIEYSPGSFYDNFSLANGHQVCWSHGAEVTARWWDAMNRPMNGELVESFIRSEFFKGVNRGSYRNMF